MERDFLGINWKDSGPAAKEEETGGRHDSAFLPGSAAQWPFSNKISSLQQFMAYQMAQEEKPKKLIFDQIPSSGYHPLSTIDSFEASNKPNAALMPQKSFGLGTKGMHQFAVHSYQAPNNDSLAKHHVDEAKTYPVVSHHSFPVATSSSFFKVHGAQNAPNLTFTSLKQQPFGSGISAANPPTIGSTVGAFTPRNVSKPSSTSPQLTIFYAGSVNVYDDMPLERAQAIMFLASSRSNAIPNAVNSRSEIPAMPNVKVVGAEGLGAEQTQSQIPNRTTSPCSGLSSPLSVSSHAGPHSGNNPSVTDDSMGAKTLAPASQNEPPKTITSTIVTAAPVTLMPRAVPQARKASLARFLEKRKERVSNASPYSCPKKNPEDNNLCCKTSSPDVALSSNMEQSWCLGQAKNPNTGDSPSTKLEM